MSLYDIMNKKPKQATVVEPVEAPVVADEKAPAPKTYAVKDSEAIASVAAPVQEAPQTVTQEKKPYTWWWQTPDFVGAVESQAKAAEKRAEQDRKRARRERNIAILGDLAKLGAQMYAKNGGAWKIDAFTPATEKANDKLAALRERHAAEVAAFARQRAAAKQAEIADNNARMKLETSLAEADAERSRRAATERANQDYRERTLKNEEERIAIAKQNAAEKKKSDATYEEYYKWLEIYPEIKVQRAVAKRNARGRYMKNEDGSQIYEYVDDENPSLRAVENAIAKAKDLERRGVKGSNGLGWGNKNKNNETDW